MRPADLRGDGGEMRLAVCAETDLPPASGPPEQAIARFREAWSTW